MHSESAWRLGHRPGLDGLRGIAILLVVTAHAFGWRALNPLGQNGVVVFFVLSGFLITNLLLEDADTDGPRLLRFYRRRALRLAPALLVVVGVVAVISAFAGSWWTSSRQLVGALTWTSNWVAPSTTQGDALAHFWSLAIEEQFYLVWPITLICLLRLPWAIQRALLSIAIAVGVLLPFLLLDAGRWHVYYGTDTRSLPLLAGCLLAMSMRRRPEGVGRPAVAGAAVVAVVALGLLWNDQFSAGWLVPQAVTGLTTLAIWATVQGGPNLLSSPWLGWLGQRSYGLYLWHPVVLVFVRHYWSLDGMTLATAVLPVSFLLTLTSWRFVETPFLRIKDRKASPAVNPSGSRGRTDAAAGTMEPRTQTTGPHRGSTQPSSR